MVKVKGSPNLNDNSKSFGFNHPMVKVKAGSADSADNNK